MTTDPATPAPPPVPEDFDAEAIAVESLVCPRCEAGPTEPCKSVSGGKAKTHASRYQPLADAYEAGRRAGHVAVTGAVGIG